ncbi:MAG: choice-of-anchor Q domain-containing protein, partial [Planctomycetota bacterium]
GSVLLLVNTTIADNYCDYRGGALYCSNGNLTIRNCTIKNNDANLIHGGIYCIGGRLNVANCLVTGNYSRSTGAGISCKNLSGVVTNCTFAGNSAKEDGGGLRCSGGRVDISNSIFRNNSPYQIYTGGGFFSVTYSDVQGGWEGEGNIDTDPLFVNAAGGDYYLMSDSPCIDAGTNEPAGGLAPTDINGVPRPMDGDDNGTMIADMGSYEYWEAVSGAPVIEVSTSLLEFSGVFRQANPPDQILSIRNWGEGTLAWEISEDCPWLNVEPNCGESTGEFDDVVLSVDIGRMVYGDYSCVLTIGAADAINSPRIVPVTLHIAIGISIQAAIDAAVAGSEVILPDGVYTGEGNRNITFRGKALTLRSKNGPQNCIIDCQEKGRGFYFDNEEGADSVLEGLTIKNGYASSGGGICCGDASPTILNCMILNNKAEDGGGIYHDGGYRWSPTIVNCVLKENVAVQHGGGLKSFYANLAVKGCTFTGNIAGGFGGGLFFSFGTAHISNCTFIGNSASGYGGGAFADADGPSIIENCTFVDNEAGLAGGGIHNSTSSPIVTNCILWNNLPQQLAGLGTFSVTYGNIQGGWTGEGNIDANPLFVDAAGGDYHLLPGSPAIDAGHPLTDWSNEPWPNGGRVNMGAYGNTAEATRSPADFDDLALLAEYWLEYDPILDIAPEPVGDGIINFLDFAIFADWWSR